MMDDLLGKRYQKNKDFIYRNVVGEGMLVPVSQKVGEIRSSIYTLNETAARAWELVDGKRTLAEILEMMVVEFEVDPGQARQDLLELVEQLVKIDALQAIEDQVGAA
jgi:hypothetical protein